MGEPPVAHQERDGPQEADAAIKSERAEGDEATSHHADGEIEKRPPAPSCKEVAHHHSWKYTQESSQRERDSGQLITGRIHHQQQNTYQYLRLRIAEMLVERRIENRQRSE